MNATVTVSVSFSTVEYELTSWCVGGIRQGEETPFNSSQVCEWVLKSWNDINTEVVVKSFKKCGISNAMDGTEDHLLYMSDSSDNSADESSVLESSSDKFLGFEDE